MTKNSMFGGETTLTGIKEENNTKTILKLNSYNVLSKSKYKEEYIRDRAGKPNNRGKHDIVLYKNNVKVVIEVKRIGPRAGSTDEKIQWLPYEASLCKKWGNVFIALIVGPGLNHVEDYVKFAKQEASKYSINNDYNREIHVLTSHNELLSILDEI